ncbi:GNAT family N-acetyltransferase [Microvirga thermotolerans]|uniref:GNAT family N-acetyltransferase n=1 Tax=Microvirga thermotolerans TaxID=2651334 RepID=A0A5P9JZ52_9HYPH|nr:GNAT family N-acetyltransferase [Microvirga thermotolerans]QFU17431.1 GNAT family N-acetyltransferase [Microvirga thermotolerans]
MTFRIDPATVADAEAIARVHVQGWRESYKDLLNPASLAGLSVEERAAMWKEGLAVRDPGTLALVGRTGEGEAVGFAIGGPTRSEGTVPLGTEAEIYAIYLLDRVKRRGLGRALMAGLFAHFVRRGFASAGLWVLRDNGAARRFYEALGGEAGPEQDLELRGQTVTEIAYRFAPIPVLS